MQLKKLAFYALFLMTSINIQAQNPIGKWKIVSHTIEMDGQKIDMHAALLQQKPCANKIVYEINEDATYRLNAAASGCHPRYVDIQQKLYSQTKWKLEGNQIMTSASNFAVGQSYTVTFSDNKMTWVGTEGQGTIIYQKI